MEEVPRKSAAELEAECLRLLAGNPRSLSDGNPNRHGPQRR
jgi:hypothetical protein